MRRGKYAAPPLRENPWDIKGGRRDDRKKDSVIVDGHYIRYSSQPGSGKVMMSEVGKVSRGREKGETPPAKKSTGAMAREQEPGPNRGLEVDRGKTVFWESLAKEEEEKKKKEEEEKEEE